jgi:hypothetical protein
VWCVWPPPPMSRASGVPDALDLANVVDGDLAAARGVADPGPGSCGASGGGAVAHPLGEAR